MCQNYENWLAVDKVITKIIRLTFLAHPVYTLTDSVILLCCVVSTMSTCSIEIHATKISK